jgi:hypothetical protein
LKQRRGRIVEISIKAAESDFFQRMCRREDFRPIKLFAWISQHSHWPDRPWSKIRNTVLKEVQKIGRFPAIIDGEIGPFLTERHSSPLQKQFDLLCFSIAHKALAEDDFLKMPNDSQRSDHVNFDLLKVSKS